MEFKTTEVRKIFSLKRNNFQDWMERGFIKPSIKKSTRKGEDNIFSKDDLYRIYLFIFLMLMGLDRSTAAEYAAVSFQSVGEEAGNYKFFKIDCKFIQIEHQIVTRHWSLLHSYSETEQKRDFEAFIVVNLVMIKKKVDELLGR